MLMSIFRRVIDVRVAPSTRRRGFRASLLLVAVFLSGVCLLTACTGSVTSTATPTATHEKNSAKMTSGVSPTSHFNDTCSHARPLNSGYSVTPTDVGFGVFNFQDLKKVANRSRLENPNISDGSAFYKTGANLAANSSARP